MRIFVLALVFLLFSSCAQIDVGIEELLAPPRINLMQTQVDEALDAHIVPGSIQYRYPQDGDYRSPFVFSDMDGNGLMEAIVFYSSPATAGGIRVKVLMEQADGDWLLVDDRAGFGDSVHIVRFAPLITPGQQNLLIGWENSLTGERRLDVFSYAGGRLELLYETGYVIFDIDRYLPGDIEQIALVRQDQLGDFQLHLLGRTIDGRISPVGETSLSVDTYEVLNLTRGGMRPGVSGIFVDTRRFDSNIATEIYEVLDVGSVLFPLVADIDIAVISELYEQTFRVGENLLSLDLRGNGRVVIPVQHPEQPLPGVVGESELEPPLLTFYMGYDYAGILEVVDTAVVNHEAGYLFFFPEKWVGHVTVLPRPELGEWQFFEVSLTTNLRTAELLRLRVYSVRDYRDPLMDYYFHLADRGIFQYYGYIPASGSPLAITPEEMHNNFMLL